MRSTRLGRLRRLLSAAAMVTVIGVVAGSCGGGESSQPIEDQLGLDQEGILARQVRLETLIRDCMKAQGWDYVPVDPVAVRTGLTGQSGFSEDDFEKQFGYGITTLYEQQKNAPADPNTAIRTKLSPTEQAAYTRALYGEFSDATFAAAVDTGDYSRLGGCTKTATEAVFGGPEVLSSLVAKLDELDQRILADPRMQKAVAKWSDCMRGAGYDGLAEPEQVDGALQKRLDAIVGPSNDRKADYDKASLATLQHDEVTMVATDKSCEKKYLQRVEGDVRSQQEAVFREQNASLLSKVVRP
jgi:hypothetical protein